MTAQLLDATAGAVRSVALDRLRGLAIALMMLDHSLLVFGAPLWTRENVTRLAMPVFFVVGGHLVHRYGRRLLGIGVLGLFLPVAVPWIDNPNVLLLYALGAVIIVQLRRAWNPWWLCAPVVLALTMYANNNGGTAGQGFYVPAALFALMALGALLPRSSFAPGDRLPAVLGTIGRRPLSWYVGHLLVLEVVRVVAL